MNGNRFVFADGDSVTAVPSASGLDTAYSERCKSTLTEELLEGEVGEVRRASGPGEANNFSLNNYTITQLLLKQTIM